MKSLIPKDIKKQIITVLKGYKDMQLQLQILEEKLETVTNERYEILILDTIDKIERDRDIIDKAISTLQDKHKSFFDLYKLDLYSVAEIAQILHVDRSTTYTYLDNICYEIYKNLLELETH